MSTTISQARNSRAAGRDHPWQDYFADGATTVTAIILAGGLIIVSELIRLSLATGVPRCGMEQWMTWLVGNDSLAGVAAMIVITAICLGVRVACERNHPQAQFSTIGCLIFESLALGLILAMLVQAFRLIFLHSEGTIDGASWNEKMEQLIIHSPSAISAGVFEEILFRLLLVGGILHLFRLAGNRTQLTQFTVVMTCGLLFASMHCSIMNPAAAPFQFDQFLFHALLGSLFGFVYLLRGLALAIGLHCSYNLFSVL